MFDLEKGLILKNKYFRYLNLPIIRYDSQAYGNLYAREKRYNGSLFGLQRENFNNMSLWVTPI